MNSELIDLSSIGWDADWQRELESRGVSGAEPARVLSVSRGVVHALGSRGAVVASPSGKMTQAAGDSLSRAVVGDWILLRGGGEGAVYSDILPRRSFFVRRAPGGGGRPQAVAANVDRVLIVTAPGGDLSPRRIERYLAAVWDGGAEPIIVVNKSDLIVDWEGLLREVNGVAMGAPVVFVTATEDGGCEELHPFVEKGKTVALVGSSGVGKSTLTNRLLGERAQVTQAVREGDDKGRHTTTQRNLFLGPSGALIIDTPGMREFGLWNAEEGLEQAFQDIEDLSDTCRFRDCSHESEPGCGVRGAIESGELDERRLGSYRKLLREVAFEEMRTNPVANRNAKARWKQIHKDMRVRSKVLRPQGLK